jgi:diaminopimelate epimerase
MSVRELRFTKMHGIGNDYVYIDGRDPTIEDLPALARAVSDRHRGIGADGLIIVEPAEEGADWDVRMRMFNADGSEAKMCGNGIRCVAKFAVDRGMVNGPSIRVATGAGVLDVELLFEGDRVLGATVDMGLVRTCLRDVPVSIPGIDSGEQAIGFGVDLDEFIPHHAGALRSAGVASVLSCVSMGNPHVILWTDRPELLDLDVIGPAIEGHPWFPERVNAHFVRIDAPDRVLMHSWERGSGQTLACGTGASAVCAAGALEGRTNDAICAHLPGGELDLRLDRASMHVTMSGPAREVFTGTLDLFELEVMQ